MKTFCHTCGVALSGGRDTFGSHDWPLCLSCRLYWMGVEAEPYESPMTLSPPGGLYSWQRGYAQPICGREVDIPNHIARCPECSGDLYVEVSEWETETGIPTDGGMLVHCRADDEATWGPPAADGGKPVRSVKRHGYRQDDWWRTVRRSQGWVQKHAADLRREEARDHLVGLRAAAGLLPC